MDLDEVEKEGGEVLVHHFDPKLNAFVPQPPEPRGPVDSEEFDYEKEKDLPPPSLRLSPALRTGGRGGEQAKDQHLTSLPEDLYQGGERWTL